MEYAGFLMVPETMMIVNVLRQMARSRHEPGRERLGGKPFGVLD